MGDPRPAILHGRVPGPAKRPGIGQHRRGFQSVGRIKIEDIHAGGHTVSRVGPPVDLAETQVLRGVPIDCREVPFQIRFDRPALCGRRRGSTASDIGRAGKELRVDDRADQREVAAHDLDVREVEQFVFANGSPHADPGLMPVFVGVERRITVAGTQGLIAEEPVRRPAQVVGPASGDGIDDAADGPSELGGVSRRLDLKLLNRILADVGTDTRAAAVLVVELERGVVAVRQERVASRLSTERQPSERAVGHHSGRQQDETIHAPPVDRQVQDLFTGHHLGDARLGRLHQRRRRGDRHRLGELGQFQLHRQRDALTDMQLDLLGEDTGRNQIVRPGVRILRSEATRESETSRHRWR